MSTAQSSLSTLTAMDLMTEKPVTLSEDMTLQEAAKLFAKHHISGAPVVDDRGQLIGALTSTDFIGWLKDEHPRTVAVFDPFYRIEQSNDFPEEPVRKHMSSFPVTVSPHARLEEIAQLMLDKHIHRVFIVDEDNRPQGVVTTTDILRAVSRRE